jgi:hypothetical protein
MAVPKERLCNRVSETPMIGRLKGEDMLKTAMARASIAEPPIMPIEATAGRWHGAVRRRQHGRVPRFSNRATGAARAASTGDPDRTIGGV